MVEQPKFNPTSWYNELAKIASFPSFKRYNALVKLHDITAGEYISALNNMTAYQASEVSSDGRTRALVVGHIAGWEEWQIQVFEDPDFSARITRQLNLKGFKNPETGEVRDFTSVDDFNAYQSHRYSAWKWPDLQFRAIETARKLQSFFPLEPNPRWIDLLDATPIRNWKVTPDITLTIPGGWYLWMVSLEHEAVEHRADLLLPN